MPARHDKFDLTPPERHPDESVWAYAERLADTAHEDDNLDRAAAALEKALSLIPDRRDWRLQLARFHHAAHHHRQAEHHYAELWHEDTSDPDIGVALATLVFQRGDFRETLRILATLLDFHPDHHPALCLKLATLVQLRRFPAAETCYRTARDLQPGCAICDLHYCHVLLATGRPKTAEQLLRQIPQPLPDPVPCFVRADLLPRAAAGVAMPFHHYDQAAELYLLADRLCPDHTDAPDLAARAYRLANRPDVALAQLQASLQRHRHSVGMYVIYAQLCLEWTRSPDKALQAAQTALQLDPTLPGIHLVIAHAAYAIGQTDLARKHLRKEALVADHTDPDAVLRLALLWTHCRRPKEALRTLYRHHACGAPPTASLLALQAALLLRRRRYADGLAAAYAALRLEPGRPDVLHNLAVAEARRGNHTAARSWARLADAVAPAPVPRLTHQLLAHRWRQRLTAFARRLLRRLRRHHAPSPLITP